jgi:hypothetical protein
MIRQCPLLWMTGRPMPGPVPTFWSRSGTLGEPTAARPHCDADGDHRCHVTGTLVYSETFWALDCVGLRDPEPATADSSHPGR